jgi:hypothetical protein
VLSSGSHTITATFAPTDTTDYATATSSVSITVNAVAPAITWATPTAIPYGTALSGTQLDASSTVAGAFSYSPAAGTVLSSGSHTITATFTPTDTTDYATDTSSVVITVNAELSLLSCISGIITGAGTDTCTLSLTAVAPSGGLTVNLTSSNSPVTVPSTVTIPAGAASAEFTATVSSVATTQTVTITASVGSMFTSFTMQLNATILALSINPTSVAFGNVVVNTPTMQQLSVTSSGTAPVTINGITLTGAGFTLSGPALPITLTPNQSTTIDITFDPTAASAATGQLTISSNASTGSTAAIPLSGTSQWAMTMTLSSSTISTGATQTGTITLGQASASSTIISLASSAPAFIAVAPSTLTVPAGQTSATFSFTGVATGTSTLTASANGYEPATAQVTAEIPAIPASLFGLSVLNFENLTPSMSFGTTRSWDAYPAFDWSDVNPSPGVYNFTYLDQFIAINQARGADIIYTLGRTPQWASSQPNAPSSDGPGQCAAPADMANWDNYLTAIATHAAGRIKYWELWNEPQSTPNYCGDIPTMVTMAQHAARIIKGIDPTALILSPAANGGPGPAWLASFLAAGGSQYVDVVAFHGYWSAQAEDVISVISNFKAAMIANGAAGKPMWDTESSWSGFGNLPTPSISQQVGFIAKDYILHWSNGVSRFVWYAYDAGIWGGLWSSQTGETDAAAAYSQTYNWLVGASLVTPCSESSNSIWTCTLSRPGGYSAEMVWISNSSATFAVPSGYTVYRDLSGTVHPNSNNSVTIGDQPILLETQDLSTLP